MYDVGKRRQPGGKAWYNKVGMVRMSLGKPSQAKEGDHYNNGHNGQPRNKSHKCQISTNRTIATGASSSGKKIQWKLQFDEGVTMENLNFESVSSLECRTWWDTTLDNHPLKDSL